MRSTNEHTRVIQNSTSDISEQFSKVQKDVLANARTRIPAAIQKLGLKPVEAAATTPGSTDLQAMMRTQQSQTAAQKDMQKEQSAFMKKMNEMRNQYAQGAVVFDGDTHGGGKENRGKGKGKGQGKGKQKSQQQKGKHWENHEKKSTAGWHQPAPQWKKRKWKG